MLKKDNRAKETACAKAPILSTKDLLPDKDEEMFFKSKRLCLRDMEGSFIVRDNRDQRASLHIIKYVTDKVLWGQHPPHLDQDILKKASRALYDHFLHNF